ncbi:hypothetical protein PQH03_23800 [Ralstonia insidiosa]|uniref:hypothetical protein n=1 Tax=Ralstonia TaxID=48736 RepID=UPI001364C568|nr:hypothetical protein [Ralstonia insidiosa]MBX3775245.1 hypothetical protein [Ralstonia pickettii]MBC9968005.1 hypothetical protein [Ralstonia insidiosa]MBX3814085.1 hypothetical protein [Ralstonia pickettii]MBX3820047.1 hypothetical protein [Ralstonia insidiosa]MBX3838486.1 hypothetical protein [Ralstonia insidiosa]
MRALFAMSAARMRTAAVNVNTGIVRVNGIRGIRVIIFTGQADRMFELRIVRRGLC